MKNQTSPVSPPNPFSSKANPTLIAILLFGYISAGGMMLPLIFTTVVKNSNQTITLHADFWKPVMFTFGSFLYMFLTIVVIVYIFLWAILALYTHATE